jgi:hypothetical protein
MLKYCISTQSNYYSLLAFQIDKHRKAQAKSYIVNNSVWFIPVYRYCPLLRLIPPLYVSVSLAWVQTSGTRNGGQWARRGRLKRESRKECEKDSIHAVQLQDIGQQ